MTDMTGEHIMVTTFDVDPCEATGSVMQSKPAHGLHGSSLSTPLADGDIRRLDRVRMCDTDCRASKTAMKGEGEGGIR